MENVSERGVRQMITIQLLHSSCPLIIPRCNLADQELNDQDSGVKTLLQEHMRKVPLMHRTSKFGFVDLVGLECAIRFSKREGGKRILAEGCAAFSGELIRGI